MSFTLRQVFRQFRQSKGFVAVTLLALALCSARWYIVQRPISS